jgi:hypothetical protein
MIIYSNLIKLFKYYGNHILIKLIMDIHEYSEYLDYFFVTLHAANQPLLQLREQDELQTEAAVSGPHTPYWLRDPPLLHRASLLLIYPFPTSPNPRQSP